MRTKECCGDDLMLHVSPDDLKKQKNYLRLKEVIADAAMSARRTQAQDSFALTPSISTPSISRPSSESSSSDGLHQPRLPPPRPSWPPNFDPNVIRVSPSPSLPAIANGTARSSDLLSEFDPLSAPRSQPTPVVCTQTPPSLLDGDLSATTSAAAGPQSIRDSSPRDNAAEVVQMRRPSVPVRAKHLPRNSERFDFPRLCLRPKKCTAFEQLDDLLRRCLLHAKHLEQSNSSSCAQWCQFHVISPKPSFRLPTVDTVKLKVHFVDENADVSVSWSCRTDATIEGIVMTVLCMESVADKIAFGSAYDSYALCDFVCLLEKLLPVDDHTYLSAPFTNRRNSFYEWVFGRDELFLPNSQLRDYYYPYACLKYNTDLEFCIRKIQSPPKQLIKSGNCPLPERIECAKFRLYEEMDKPPLELATIETIFQTIYAKASSLLEAMENGESVCPVQTVQSIKLLCELAFRVETSDLTNVITGLESLCKTIQAERCKYLEIHGNSASFCNCERFHSLRRQLGNHLRDIFTAIVGLLRLLDVSALTNFTIADSGTISSVDRSRTITPTEMITSIVKFAVVVERLCNVPPQWQGYDSFILQCHLLYGHTDLLPDDTISVHASPDSTRCCLRSTLNFDNKWVGFNIELCRLPREAKLRLDLFGCTAELGANAAVSTADANSASISQSGSSDRYSALAHSLIQQTPLGWFSIPLLDLHSCLHQGEFLLKLNPESIHPDAVPPVDASTAYSRDLKNCPLLIIRFPSFDSGLFVFPKIEPAPNRPISTNPLKERRLHRIMGSLPASFGMLPSDDKQCLWEHRHKILELYPSSGLDVVLACAPGFDWANLTSIAALLPSELKLQPIDALILLLPRQPDIDVRALAIRALFDASTDSLLLYSVQIVRALRFEVSENSLLAEFLLTRSLSDLRFSCCLYWLLRLCAIEGDRRCRMLKQTMLALVDETRADEFRNQELLVAKLDEIAHYVKANAKNPRVDAKVWMQQQLRLFTASLTSPVRLPFAPEFSISNMDVPACSYFDSFNAPLKLQFLSNSASFGVLYKHGDDLRKDSLVMQLVSIMEEVWLQEGIDLKIVLFRCLPTDVDKGFIELIPSSSLREIYISEAGIAGVFRPNVLQQWLQRWNNEELQFRIRHNDNILITTRGNLFHADFGKLRILGESQTIANIDRDRDPFVLTSDMLFVINGGSSQNSENFLIFVDYCLQAFTALRKHYLVFVNVLQLMQYAGLPGLTLATVKSVRDNLFVGDSDSKAAEKFSRLIEDVLYSNMSKINFLIHTVAHMKFIDSEAADEMLSFVARTYNSSTDPKIASVTLIDCEKSKTPEKLCFFKLKVERKSEPPHLVYRTYKEFCELYEKLRSRFTSLTSLATVGLRKRESAERQKLEISSFLDSVFQMTEEIAHCDLIYSFFHPLLRDQKDLSPEEISRGPRTHGEIELVLNLEFDISNANKAKLEVFVKHARNLINVGDDLLPDSYAKLYLLQSTVKLKSTKQKTKVIAKTKFPVFNQTFLYDISFDLLASYELEVTLWHRIPLGENNFLGGVRPIALQLLSENNFSLRSWYPLESTLLQLA